MRNSIQRNFNQRIALFLPADVVEYNFRIYSRILGQIIKSDEIASLIHPQPFHGGYNYQTQ